MSRIPFVNGVVTTGIVVLCFGACQPSDRASDASPETSAAAGFPREQKKPPRAPAAEREARRHGEVYENVVRDAWSGDSLALSFLFGYEDSQAFAGVESAAAEHRKVMWDLVEHLGEARIVSVLGAEIPHTRISVLDGMERVAPGRLVNEFPDLAKLRDSGAPK